MSGIFVALLTTVSWSIGIFPFTEASRKVGAGPVNQYRLLLAWIIISALLFLIYRISFVELFTSANSHQFIFLGLSGIIGFTIGDYCSFRSFTILGPKLGSLYTTFAPGAALLAGYIILNENVNWIGMLGICVTISGVVWLSISKADKKAAHQAGFSRNRLGILLGIVGAFCQGTGLVLSKLGMEKISSEQGINTLHAVWIRLLFAFGGVFLISTVTGKIVEYGKPILVNKNNVWPYMILGTVLGPIAGVYGSLVAIQKLEVAVAQTIFALLPVLVLPLNYFVYKEKITPAALYACLVAIGGVVLLIWRNEF